MVVYKVDANSAILIVLLCVGIHAQDVNSDTGVLPYKELLERQKLEFVDALGYGNYEHVGVGVADVVGVGVEKTVELNPGNLQSTNKEQHAHRRIARSGGSSPYDLIAGISGGSVLHVDKDNVSSGVDILSSATLGTPVIITRQQLRINGNALVEFYVDISVSKVTVQAQTRCCKPGVTVIDPDGHTVSTTDANVTVKADTTKLYYLEIGSLKVGKWTIHLEDTNNQIYDVEVRGSSLVTFGSTFSDITGSDVSGQPTSGSNSTYVKVTPYGGDKVKNWTNFVVKATNGTVLQKIPLGTPKGRVEHIFLLPVTWPNMDVHVGVEGFDTSGNPFTREQRTSVIPLGVRLTLTNPDLEFITTCDKDFDISFMINNQGPAANFTLSITSNNPIFKVTVSPSSVIIAANSVTTALGTLTFKTIPSRDQTVTVDIRAVSADGNFQYVQQDLIARCGVTDESAGSRLQSCIALLLTAIYFSSL